MIPYEGSKPYAFVSYAQTDAEQVLPIVQKLSDMGYRLWFANNPAQQEQSILRLSRCAVVVAFASPDSGLTGTCRQDVYYAQGQNKPVLGVFPGAAIGDADRKKLFGEAPCVCRADCSDEASFVEAICSCPELEPCREKESSHGTGGKIDLTPVKNWVKKYWPSLAAVAAAVLVLLIGYRTIHVWSAASCTQPAVCRLCGKERAPAAGHDWASASCTVPKTCKKCAVTEGGVLGHSWQGASCTEPETCRICGAVNGDATGHLWSDATCQTPAFCVVCGTQGKKADDHQWWYATCTRPRTCITCGITSGDPLGHTWIDATLTEPKTCLLCGETEGEPLENTQSRPQFRAGDTILFGTYEQDNNTGNGPEPLEWIVLEATEDRIFVITKYAVERICFHDSLTAVTWEDCYLRQWLNDSFYWSAFSEGERSQILSVHVPAEANPYYDNDPGRDTQDKLYVLSTSEAAWYFPDKEDRLCYPTESTEASGYLWKGDEGCVWWWLRTRGELDTDATTVNSDGSIDYKDGRVDATSGAVRPVMWIKLK